MAGGGGGNLWIKMLVGGGICVAIGTVFEHSDGLPHWAVAGLLAVGGMAVVFGSCEAMIKSVEGMGQRLRWNPFVAGTMGGLASNVPELVMLGFVVAASPRLGFIVVALTLHVGALAFGIYSGFLPRDASGHAKLPEPLVKLSTDLYACAAGVFLATGILMLTMKVFAGPSAENLSLTVTDLAVMGVLLLMVEVVAVRRLVKRFSADPAGDGPAAVADPTVDRGAAPSVASIAMYGVIGVGASVVGGHAVGAFADILVISLREAGYSEMLAALLLSVFACAGAYAMIATAHVKGMYDIALANVSGAVTQVPFVVLPVVMLLMAVFAATGVTEPLPGGGVLAVDMQTTSVLLLAFPPMLVLWKAIQDDGKVNWVETSSMLSIFLLTLYFLATHG